MPNHGTASQLEVDGAYVEFQLAVLRALPRNIDPDIADGWRNNGQGLAKILREALFPLEKPEPKPVPPILKLVGTVTIAARTTRFVPKNVFTTKNTRVRFGYVDPNFTVRFGEKAEEPTTETKLRCHVLTRLSAFVPAVQEISDGGVTTKTTPGELYSMMEKQPNGEAGSLLTNGYANLFEMDDVNGVSRRVRAVWSDNGGDWGVYASVASFSFQWHGGHRLFSRDSR